MRRLVKCAVALVAALVAAPVAEAQRAGIGIAVGAQQTSMDPVWARDRGMSSSGPGIHLALDFEAVRFVVASLEWGALFYKDQRQFSQSVICIPNCTGGSETSSISVITTGGSRGAPDAATASGPN